MDGIQEMQKRGVVGLPLFEKDREADNEDVDLGCEGVAAVGGEDAFAKFAHRHC